MMKYTLFILALFLVVNVNAQTNMQRTPEGAMYQVFTHNNGDKIKLNDIITFQFIQKTDKDSVLFSSYASGRPGQLQIVPSKSAIDLMEIFPLLTLKDSVLIRIPTDSIFKGHEDQRPNFFAKGSNLNLVLKIEKIQTLDQAIAEIKEAEFTGAAKYIASHKLNVTTTPSGLKYVITKPSLKAKPLKGDTVFVNYTGRTLDEKVFDSSIEAVAKGAALEQPGRTYEPLQVIVGAGGIITGWEEGLQLLGEGAKATFVIPSKLAYGEQGQGAIRPFSTLVFDLEIVKIKPVKHPAAAPAAKHVYHKKKPVSQKN